MNKKHLIEISLVPLTGIVIMVVLALLSYNPDDLGHPEPGQVANLLGWAGAVFAGYVYYWVGWSAFLALGLSLWMMLHPLWLQWRLATSPTAAATSTWGSLSLRAMVRAFGGSLMLVSGALLCTLLLPPDELPQGAGGVVGQNFAEKLTLIGDWGSFIVALVAFITSVPISTGISWVGIILSLPRLLWPGAGGAVHPQPRGMQPQTEGSGKKEERKELDGETNLSKPATAERSPSKSKTTIRARNAPPPTVALLETAKKLKAVPKEDLVARAKNLEEALANYNIRAKVMKTHAGPVVTRFDLQLEAGQRVSRVASVARDLTRDLKVEVGGLRIVENIAGTSYFGIEEPNAERKEVSLSQAVATPAFGDSKATMPVALGVNLVGEPVVTDFAAMPHLLVAGATGSGKSVCVHAILLSLLLRNSAEDLRLVLIDPKRTELSAYAELPHLVAPVITDMVQATDALAWCVREMGKRNELLAAAGVRGLAAYNEQQASGDGRAHPLPRILVVIDELAALIQDSDKDKVVEQSIVRIAQEARSAGIHLLLATQSPRADVLTGLIRANVRARIAFQVLNQIESRIILNVGGAEQLLGRGDMLCLLPGEQHPKRVHGAFVSEEEVARVVDAWKKVGAPDWIEQMESFQHTEVASSADADADADADAATELDDEEVLYEEAKSYVMTSGTVSAAALRRHCAAAFAHRCQPRFEAGGEFAESGDHQSSG